MPIEAFSTRGRANVPAATPSHVCLKVKSLAAFMSAAVALAFLATATAACGTSTTPTSRLYVAVGPFAIFALRLNSRGTEIYTVTSPDSSGRLVDENYKVSSRIIGSEMRIQLIREGTSCGVFDGYVDGRYFFIKVAKRRATLARADEQSVMREKNELLRSTQ